MSRLGYWRPRGTGVPVPSGDADITWTDEVSVTDNPAIASVLPDEVTAEDALGILTVRPSDDASMDDAYTAVVSASRTLADDTSTDDALLGRVNDIYVPRSGTPDTDFYGDGWVDGLLANQGVNHGNESPCFAASEDILATTRQTYMEFDLTKFAGVTAPTGGTMVLAIFTDHAVAVLQTYTVNMGRKAARPFTESTLTWTNKPAAGTSPASAGGSALVRLDILTPQFQNSTVSFTAAQYGPWLGGWLQVQIVSNSLIATPLNIASREHSVAAQRPRLSFDFKAP